MRFHTNNLVRICKVPLSRFDSEEQFSDEQPGQSLYFSPFHFNILTVADDDTPTAEHEYTPTVADSPTAAEPSGLIEVVDLLTPPASPHIAWLGRSVDIFEV